VTLWLLRLNKEPVQKKQVARPKISCAYPEAVFLRISNRCRSAREALTCEYHKGGIHCPRATMMLGTSLHTNAHYLEEIAFNYRALLAPWPRGRDGSED
jgi:hypothetical protein